MEKRYMAYVDIGERGSRKGKLQSMALAEFDASKLPDDELTALRDHEEGESVEFFLDNIRPYYYHYAVDFNDASLPGVIIINGKDPDGEVWPANTTDTFKNIEDAKTRILSHLRSDTIERGLIKILFA